MDLFLWWLSDVIFLIKSFLELSGLRWAEGWDVYVMGAYAALQLGPGMSFSANPPTNKPHQTLILISIKTQKYTHICFIIAYIMCT